MQQLQEEEPQISLEGGGKQVCLLELESNVIEI